MATAGITNDYSALVNQMISQTSGDEQTFRAISEKLEATQKSFMGAVTADKLDPVKVQEEMQNVQRTQQAMEAFMAIKKMLNELMSRIIQNFSQR